MCTCVGVGQRVGFSLNGTGSASVFIYLLHRVEVNGVDTAECRQTYLVFSVLVCGLRQSEQLRSNGDSESLTNLLNAMLTTSALNILQ